MSDQDQPVEVVRIVISHTIEPDGTSVHHTEWSDDLGFVEGLGLLEAAKDTFTRACMEEADG